MWLLDGSVPLADAEQDADDAEEQGHDAKRRKVADSKVKQVCAHRTSAAMRIEKMTRHGLNV
jgi:hypothetical protein